MYSASAGGADASALHDEKAGEDPGRSFVEDTMRSNVLRCCEGRKITGEISIIHNTSSSWSYQLINSTDRRGTSCGTGFRP